MTRCPEECGKQWRLVQEKLGWEKQKEKEAKKRKNDRGKESSRGMGDIG